MERDHLVASSGDTTEVVDVLDSWTHRGGTYAKVEGDHLSGFVEVPENPRSPDAVLVCTECGHYEEDERGHERLVDIKQRRMNSESSAEMIADIHECLTGHRGDVELVA